MPAESMREQLEEAFNESEEEEATEETGGSPEDTEEPIRDTGEPEGEESSEEDSGDTGELPAEGTEPKDGDDKAAEDKVGGAEKQDTGGESSVKAPASWKAEGREHWAKIPAEAQREIQRREKHMDNMVRESAETRKFTNDFNQAVRPFEGMIAAQRSTPMQAMTNLMQTAAGLTMGSPQQKAQIVQNIMGQYGIDIEVLDQVLAGGMAQQQNQIGAPKLDPNIAFAIQQQMAPVQQFMGQMNQQRSAYEQTQQDAITGDINTFAADPKNEFFGDVRDTMADLMDMSANRGEEMTIQSAYDTACRMNEGISGVIGKRIAKANADARRAEIGGKQNAASSVHGAAGSSSPNAGADSLRGAITDAWDDAS